MGALEFYEGKRESYWIYRIDLPPDPETGRRRQKKIARDRKTGARWTSKKTCRTAMQAHEVELRTGIPVDVTTRTVDEHLEQWLSQMEGRVTPSTLMQYRRAWNRLRPRLGSIKLQSLQALAVQSAFDELRKRLAPNTLHLTHSVLHQALEQAVKWEILPRNPASSVSLPSARPRAPRAVWTTAETQTFLAAIETDPDGALWWTLLDTGARIGEALALTWDHVSLGTSPPVIRIERTLTRVPHGWAFGASTKTESGRRFIYLQPSTVAALQAHQLQQQGRRNAYGEHWQDHGLVFDRGDGGILTPTAVGRHLKRACEKAGVPAITPHSMRHTMTTIAAQRGVPLKLLADRLGHSGIRLVANLYAHPTLEGDMVVSDALKDVFRP